MVIIVSAVVGEGELVMVEGVVMVTAMAQGRLRCGVIESEVPGKQLGRV